MPISTTETSLASSSRSSVWGTPSSLLKFFWVLWVLKRSDSTDATISLVVVLPTLPVMPMTGMWKRERCHAASAPMARRVDGTCTQGRSSSAGSRSDRQHTAPSFRQRVM